MAHSQLPPANSVFCMCAFMYLFPPTWPSTHPQATRIQMACAAYKHAWLSRAGTSMEAQQVQGGSLSLQDVRWLRAQWLLSRTLNAALYDVSSTRTERRGESSQQPYSNTMAWSMPAMFSMQARGQSANLSSQPDQLVARRCLACRVVYAPACLSAADPSSRSRRLACISGHMPASHAPPVNCFGLLNPRCLPHSSCVNICLLPPCRPRGARVGC
jgi:hypothetical protein